MCKQVEVMSPELLSFIATLGFWEGRLLSDVHGSEQGA